MPESMVRGIATGNAPLTGRNRYFELFFAGLCFVIVSAIVQHPFRADGFIYDDFLWTMMLAGLFGGSPGVTFVDYYTTDMEHFYLLFKSIYAVEWKLFAKNALFWHIVTVVIHSSCSTLLYLLLRDSGISRFGSLLAGFLLSQCSVGHWDSPFYWRGGSVLTICLLGYLVMLTLYFHARQNPKMFLPWALSASIFVLLWNQMLVFLFCFGLYVLLFDRETFCRMLRANRWLARALAAVSISLSVAVTVVVTLLLLKTDRDVRFGFYELGEVVGLFTDSLFEITSVFHFKRELAWLAVPLVGVVAFACRSAPRRALVIMGLLMAPTLVLLVEIAIGRDIVDEGRYLYFGTAVWSTFLGVAMDRLWLRLQVPMKSMLAVLLICLGGVSLVMQYSHAASATRRPEIEWWDSLARKPEAMKGVVIHFSETHTAVDPVILPDVPLAHENHDVVFGMGVYFPVQFYVAAAFPNGFPGCVIRKIDELSDEQIAAADHLLSRVDEPGVEHWRKWIKTFVPDHRFLQAINRKGVEKNTVIEVPEALIHYEELGVDLKTSSIVRMAYRDPLNNVTIVEAPMGSRSRELVKEVLEEFPTEKGALAKDLAEKLNEPMTR